MAKIFSDSGRTEAVVRGNRLKTFVINLKHEAEKKERMLEKCTKAGIRVEIIEAVYGKALDDDVIANVYSGQKAIGYFGRELTRGEIGTALSHLNVCAKIVETPVEAALVLEDDVGCSFDAAVLLEMIDNLPADWECVLLGHHTKRARDIDTLASVWNQKRVAGGFRCIRFAEQPYGAYAYLINRAGARKMLENFRVIDRPIDHWHDRRINLYGMKPSIASIDPLFHGQSNLAGERDGMKERTRRSAYGKTKDFVRHGLGKVGALEIFFFFKNAVLRLKYGHSYEQSK